jgi:predicted MFS family arabinose efflux permease
MHILPRSFFATFLIEFLDEFVFGVAALMVLGSLWFTRKNPLPNIEEAKEATLVVLRAALNRPEVLRYVFLLEFADLLADVFLGFLALYLVDVLLLNASQAGLGVLLWTVGALVGDALLLFILARVESTRYLLGSALVSAALCALSVRLFSLDGLHAACGAGALSRGLVLDLEGEAL